jgi:Plasmid pRiA4b ORF-3-like protein
MRHRPFSHPFPNTGSRSRSIARKVPGPYVADMVVRIRDVPIPGAKVGYTYDFGVDQEHEIRLERTLPSQDYPVCVEWRGDSPVEYWSEDDPEKPERFSLTEVNRQPAALGGAGD